VPAWAEFMKRATMNDSPDWFTPPSDVEKVTICRLSGLRATDACRHGIVSPDYVQAGLTEMPGVPAGGAVAVVTPRRRVDAPIARSLVYDDYFPIGTAPTEECPIHGDATFMPGIAGAGDAASTMDTPAASTIGTTGHAGTGGAGLVAVGYGAAPPHSTGGTHLEKVVGADGRAIWVVKQ